jgi:hypothetical protein
MPCVVRYRLRLAVSEAELAGMVIHRERLTTPEGGHADGLLSFNSFLSYPQKMRVRHCEPSEPI